MPDATASSIGEFGLIEQVVARLGTSPAVLVGPGDDAAVVAAADGRVVATTDVLVEGVHFRRDWSSAHDVGCKAAAASLADVAAMGGSATALLVGLAAPGDLPVSWATALAEGLRDEAARVGAVVVGGDTVSCDVVVVSVTALGDLAGRPPVTRSGARPGQDLVLAGELGRSAAGLERLRAGEREGALVDAHRRPSPPYLLGPVLARLGATAMCDVSDGLLQDLGHLARASGVRMVVEPERLVRSAGVSLQDALTGGEDHALVATVLAGTALPDGVVRIGRVQAGGGVGVSGEAADREVPGWQHFSGRPAGLAAPRRRSWAGAGDLALVVVLLLVPRVVRSGPGPGPVRRRGSLLPRGVRAEPLLVGAAVALLDRRVRQAPPVRHALPALPDSVGLG